MSRLGLHSLGTSFDCTCGETHALPIYACHVGTDAAERLAEYAQKKCGRSCLVVSDENTRNAGGEAVLSALSGAGKKPLEKIFPGDPLEATQAAGEEVRRLGAEADFFVAIGSGTLCDLAKYAGDQLQRPVLLYPTAASMNGYTSGITALKVRGLKRTMACRPAEGVFGDPEVVATAPQRMVAAGVGDFLSKCSSSTDWRAAHLLRGGYFCERPREFFEGSQEKVLGAAPRAGRGENEAVGDVLEALLLSGLSMIVAGSSAPASGGEHLLSHYLDMKAALDGTPHDLHGAQVGVGTIHCLTLWERILDLEAGDVNAETLAGLQPSDEAINGWIDDDWGDVAPEVRAQWRTKSLDTAGVRSELALLKETLPSFQRECRKDLLPPAVVANAIREAGGPVSPEALNAPLEEWEKALRYARYIRNRFTVLDLAAELGLGS